MRTVRVRTAMMAAVLATALLVPTVAMASAYSTERSLIGGLFSFTLYGEPDINGGNVVWRSKSGITPGAKWGISRLNLVTGQTSVIATDASWDLVNPRVSSDWIVWAGGGDVYAKNIKTGAKKNVTNDGLVPIDVAPSLSGSRLVWVRNNGTDNDIWYKNLANNNAKSALVTGVGNQDQPSISGTRVAYRDGVVPAWGQIKVKTVGGGTKVITNNTNNQDAPSMGSHLVAWRAAVGAHMKLRYYNYDTDQVTDGWQAPWFDPAVNIMNPQVSGDRILFDWDDGPSQDLAVWDLRAARSAGIPFVVEESANDEIWGKIAGNSFVFLNDDSPVKGRLLAPSITIGKVKSHVGRGHRARIYGSLSDQGVRIGGANIRIERQSGSKWNLVTTVHTSSAGNYSWTSPKIYSTRYYRAAYDGQYMVFGPSYQSHMSAVSTSRRVRP